MIEPLTFLSELEPETAGPPQYRLTRMQLVNWGTFDGFHPIPISARGHLLTGRSGRGKSTILDAVSAVLFAPKDLDFNAAARDSTTKGRDRTILTYVRGAHSSLPDEFGETTTQYLREKKSVWSAISLEFTHPDRGVISLIRLFRVSDSAMTVEQVTKVGMILNRPLDLNDLEPHVINRLDSKVLKRQYEPLYVGPDPFSTYQDRFMREFGLSDQAMKLLQRTQAMKGLASLDALMRDFMLDEPDTKQHGDRAVGQHENLRAAHEAVVTARDQRDRLRPVVGLETTIRESQKIREQLLAERAAVENVRTTRAITILEFDLAHTTRLRERADSDVDALDKRLQTLSKEQSVARSKYDNAGGSDLRVIDTQIEQARNEHTTRLKARERFTITVIAAGHSLPIAAADFEALVITAAREAAASVEKLTDCKPKNHEAVVRVSETRKQLNRARTELEALKLRRSNVDMDEDRFRRRIAEAAGIPADRLPFVAELLEVRADEIAWRGPTERVLGGFARSILVPREYYTPLCLYVNENHLRGVITFYPVDQPANPVTPKLASNALIGKLRIADGEFHDWLLARLHRQFDYRCVENLNDVSPDLQAVTRQGLERGRNDRHVKDDRHSIDDAQFWVLGFENTAKRKLFEDAVFNLASEFREAEAGLDNLDRDDEATRSQLGLLERIAEQPFDTIDAASAAQQVALFERTRRSILRGSDDLAGLSDALETVELKMTSASSKRDKAVGDRGAAEGQRTLIANKLDTHRIRLAGLPEIGGTVTAAVDARFGQGTRKATIDSLDAAVTSVRESITDDIESQRRKVESAATAIVKTFTGFKHDWPTVASDLDDTLNSLPEFLALLQKIEEDRLPDFQDKFRELMRTGPARHLIDLARKLDEERSEIDRRINPINFALEGMEFNEGTFLQINVRDVAPQALHDFKRDLRTFLQDATQASEETAERRYVLLSEIIEKLSSDQYRDWRTKVLDVRRHVSFVGNEIRGDQVVDTYSSGDGRSGGQRAKFLTFTLAAALRYQLTKASTDVPLFATVPMDEALSKADVEFTEQSLEVFEKFGFQLILATPNKMIATFEKFVGAATIVDHDLKSHFSSLSHVTFEPASDLAAP